MYEHQDYLLSARFHIVQSGALRGSSMVCTTTPFAVDRSARSEPSPD
jgi:hypothetical protein